MDDTSARVTATGPLVALALAGGAVISFGVGGAVGYLSEAAESAFVLTGLLGWVLLVWAVIVAGACSVGLIRRALARRPVTGTEWVLLSACVALIVLTALLHLPWGSGSGFG